MSSDLHYSNLEAPILDASRDGNKKFGRGSDMLGFWPVVFTVTNGMIGPVILVISLRILDLDISFTKVHFIRTH